MAKDKVKPAKRPMKHKKLEKKGITGAPVKAASPPPPKKIEKPDAWAASYAAAQREATGRERVLVEALIIKLPDAIFDPEKSAGEISRKLWRLDKTIPPETEQRITDGLASAHANRIGHLLEVMATHDMPEAVRNQIDNTVAALERSGQIKRAFKKFDVEDRAGLDAKLNDAFEARYAAIAERRLLAQVHVAQECYAKLQRTTSPAAVKVDLVVALDKLGDQQIRAFPEGVKTREDMNKRIDEAYAAAVERAAEAERSRQAELAKYKFTQLGEGSSSYFWRPSNPDAALAELRKAIAEGCDGDVMRLARGTKLDTAEAVENAISKKHDAGIEAVAKFVLENNGHYAPKTGYFGADLKKVQEIAATGHSPADALQELKDDRYSYMRSSKPVDSNAVEAIMKADEPHAAVRFALVAHHYAKKGEPHDGVLAKARRRAEAAGGVDALDASAKLLKIEDSKWEEMKTMLAAPAAMAATAVPVVPAAREIAAGQAAVVAPPVAAVNGNGKAAPPSAIEKPNGHAAVAPVNGGGNGATPVAETTPRAPAKPAFFTKRSGDLGAFLATMAPKPPA